MVGTWAVYFHQCSIFYRCGWGRDIEDTFIGVGGLGTGLIHHRGWVGPPLGRGCLIKFWGGVPGYLKHGALPAFELLPVGHLYVEFAIIFDFSTCVCVCVCVCVIVCVCVCNVCIQTPQIMGRRIKLSCRRLAGHAGLNCSVASFPAPPACVPVTGGRRL